MLYQLHVGETLLLGIRVSDNADGQPLSNVTVTADLWAPDVDRTKNAPTVTGVELAYDPRTRDHVAYLNTDHTWPVGRWTYGVTTRRRVNGRRDTSIDYSTFTLQP